MDIGTIIGIGGGVFLLLSAIGFSELVSFFNVPSLLIVGGGTIAATLICYPLNQVMSVLKVVKHAFAHKAQAPLDIIRQMVSFAERARRDGILALDNVTGEVEDIFLRTGIQLAVDGVEPDTIKDIMNTELSFIEERHELGQSVLANMGVYSPAFGMIGTLIGLVAMLKTLSDPSTIGPAMALALLTTLYGAIMANLIFLPLAEKLKIRSAQERLIKEITIEGIMSIQSGDNPRIVNQKLVVFLSSQARAEMETERQAA